MIAEIHRKISADGSNLTDRMEDDLTGNYFGNLRYLPFEHGMKEILSSTVYPDNLLDGLKLEQKGSWPDNIRFWPRYPADKKRTELDVVIEFENIIIGIEVKLHSGLSSDDTISYADRQEEEKLQLKFSCNQLDREAELLKKVSHGKKDVVLLFLANELSCQKVYQQIMERKLVSDVKFGYISWQNVYEATKNLRGRNPYEKVILSDLVDLLTNKGFERFQDFEVEKEIDYNLIWNFGEEFNFMIKEKIDRRQYYEFG